MKTERPALIWGDWHDGFTEEGEPCRFRFAFSDEYDPQPPPGQILVKRRIYVQTETSHGLPEED